MMCDVEEENAISSRAEPDGSFGNLDVTVTNHNNLCAKGVTHMMCDVEEENAISSFDKEHIISSSNLTAASELCERLTTLTERWECELMFHEIPPDTRHRLLLMDPNSPSLHEFVDLCKYMDKKTGLRDRRLTNYPWKDVLLRIGPYIRKNAVHSASQCFIMLLMIIGTYPTTEK